VTFPGVRDAYLGRGGVNWTVYAALVGVQVGGGQRFVDTWRGGMWELVCLVHCRFEKEHDWRESQEGPSSSVGERREGNLDRM